MEEEIKEIKKMVDEVEFNISKRTVDYFDARSLDYLFTVTNPVYIPKVGETILLRLSSYADNGHFEVIRVEYEIDNFTHEAIESFNAYISFKIS